VFLIILPYQEKLITKCISFIQPFLTINSLVKLKLFFMCDVFHSIYLNVGDFAKANLVFHAELELKKWYVGEYIFLML